MLLHLLVKNDYQIYSELMELSQFEIVHIKKSPIIFHVVTQIEKLDIEKKTTTNYLYESMCFVSDMRTIRERER